MDENTKAAAAPGEKGSIHISEEVVASVAALAASETEGVSHLATGAGMDFSEWLGKKNITKGVKIVIEEDRAMVDVSLFVRYGYSIPSVAKRVQMEIKTAIESMTGLVAQSINVHVCGVSFANEKKAVKNEKK